uniref:Carbamoyl phosphate synthase ATP-binding domain-containing protein n=1 Tax=Ditylum brightwellii TaxID=49249 RepID=A0A7S2EE88_9STRA|mmetsp:Transcript_25718/g.38216  ORF Transcript_25718/g.38216 Transcript_25718/m.38216 type:complete len:127 (+) Transcript_25718:247-627(+)
MTVQYVNAGTIEILFEFTLDKIYVCDINTRLQVEHPIIELFTGVDLVEWQLRIAAGEPLPIINQKDVLCIGHAIEARLCAENTRKGFIPALLERLGIIFRLYNRTWGVFLYRMVINRTLQKQKENA